MQHEAEPLSFLVPEKRLNDFFFWIKNTSVNQEHMNHTNFLVSCPICFSFFFLYNGSNMLHIIL